MFKKKPGVTIVETLPASLLTKADSNGAYKEIFVDRMMNNVRRPGLMPEKVYSKKGKTADDGTLARTLINDIVQQSRRSASLSSIDAANYYDIVAHAIALMVF